MRNRMRPARHVIGIVLPVATIAAFTALLVYSFLQLDNVQRDMRIEATQNMLWVLSRAHGASLRLSEGTARYALGDETSDEVSRRLDIWFSTTQIVRDGPQRRRMAAFGFGDDLEQLADSGPALETAITALLAGDHDAAAQVHAILSPLEASLSRAANQAMVAEWDELGAKLDKTRSGMRQIGVSLAAIAVAGIVLVIHLVFTARASARHARLLKQERAFSELLVSSGGMGIVAVDKQGRCTLWNAAMAPLFGLGPAQALGQSLGSLAGFFDVDRVRQAVDAALTGEHRRVDDQPLFRSGTLAPLWLDMEVFPLRNPGGITGAILLVSDVTERHEAQHALARHRDQLEDEVARRTQDLDAALTRERAALDVYRNFAAMISHQFRTPLAIVDSSLQRLMRRGDRLSREELAERGQQTRAAIARLVRLVETTLDAARLDAGQVEISRMPCDLAAIAQEAIRQDTSLQSRAKLAVTDGLPAIAYGDPVQIEHIVLNLMSNAIKYAPEGSTVRVEISGDDQWARCRIVNAGRIEAGEQEHLFERYFRGVNSRHASGIGIGLYMARNLARLQGGDVRLDDSQTGFVAFELSLPRAEAPATLSEGAA